MLFNFYEKIIFFWKNTVLTWFSPQMRQCFKQTFLYLFIPFLCAYIICTYMSVELVGAIKSLPISMQKSDLLVGANASKYDLFKKQILERNIFSLKGDLPPEDNLSSSKNARDLENVPCAANVSLPVQVVGIIYTGNPSQNLVTVQDAKVAMADVYKEGQEIIDYESYTVYKVSGPAAVEFRRGTQKICVSLNSAADSSGAQGVEAAENAQNVVTLTYNYVTSELGKGYSKILSTSHFLPAVSGGKTLGFRIASLTKGSLFDKVGLQKEDIITSVNGRSLADPSQGFRIYESFEQDNKIEIQLLRNGSPQTKKVVVQ